MLLKNIIKTLFSIILISACVFLMHLINSLGLYNNKYILLISTFILVLIILLICLIFELKGKIKILCYFIGIVFLFFIAFISYYLNNTLTFINGASKVVSNYDNYYIVSLKSNDADQTVGVTPYVSDALSNINGEIIEYSDRYELYDNLVNDKIDKVCLSDIDVYFLEQDDKDFINKINIIDVIKIKKEKIKLVSKEITNESFIIYISGIDTLGEISKVSRSDVNIIVVINPNTNQVLLVNIPRDYYVQLHNTTGLKDKLTHAGLYGIDMSINTVQDLLDININYYVRINFDSVINVIDEIGGIDVYSDQDLNFCNIKKGTNHLDGKCALRFARERKSYLSGDRHRGENQEEVINGAINKIKNNKLLLFKYNSILNKLKNNFETNIKEEMIKDFIKKEIKDLPKWSIKSYNLNGSDEKNYTYSMGRNKLLYVMEPDYNTIKKAKSIISDIISGKDFKQIKEVGAE